MEGLALTNLAEVGALPGLSMQFVVQTLATVFLARLRIGAFLIASTRSSCPEVAGFNLPSAKEATLPSASYSCLSRIW